MDPAAIRNIPPKIVSALKLASRETGADFDYLVKTAARESAFKPGAKAKSSSASGLFQFIEQTWLGTLKAAGGRHGLGKLSAMISRDSDGKFRVSDPAKRKALLALRFDPKLSALMAGEFTRANQTALQSRIGRPPTDGELYIGHFLGAGKAARLINLAAKHPKTAANVQFPRAAKANRAIFYDKAGKARSVAAVYRNLTRHYSNEIAAATARPEAKNAAEHAGEGGDAARSGPVRPLTHALFTLWRTPANEGAGQGGASPFYNLFLPGHASGGQARGAIGGAGAIGASGNGARQDDALPAASYIPRAEAFASAFGNSGGGNGPGAPETDTAAGRIRGDWGSRIKSSGLLARRRPGAL